MKEQKFYRSSNDANLNDNIRLDDFLDPILTQVWLLSNDCNQTVDLNLPFFLADTFSFAIIKLVVYTLSSSTTTRLRKSEIAFYVKISFFFAP